MYNLEDVLRDVSFLRGAPYSLQGLENAFSMAPFKENETIVTEGKAGSFFYILLAGKVLLYNKSPDGRETALQTLQPPKGFGELNLLAPEKWAFSAKALEDSILCCLDSNVFLEYLQKTPLLLPVIFANLGGQIRHLEIRNKVLTNINAKLSAPRPERDPRSAEPPGKAAGGDGAAYEAGSVNDGGQPHPTAPGESAHHSPGPTGGGEPTPEQNLANRLKQRLAETPSVQESFAPKEEASSAEMLYAKKTVCPLCQAKFESSKVLSKYIKVEKIDQDLCKHHKFADPLNYEINVCPYCGYAFNEETAKIRLRKDLADETKANLAAFWGADKVKDYCSERSLDDALETFLLALYCLRSVPIKKSQLSLLHLKIAWLYRHKGEQTLETEYLNSALENLTFSFEKESITSVRGEINTLYLLGVLNFQIGQYKTAARWLERILRHKSKTAFPLIVNQARDIWSEVRTALREEQEEAPPDDQ